MCRLVEVMTETITRILELRAEFGTEKRTLFQNIDVKSAFRQVGFAPNRVTAFVYRGLLYRPGGTGARGSGVQ